MERREVDCLGGWFDLVGWFGWFDDDVVRPHARHVYIKSTGGNTHTPPHHHTTPTNTRFQFSEKSVGYVAVSLLMKSEDEMMTLVVNSVRNDLVSHNNFFQVRARCGVCWGEAGFQPAVSDQPRN
jgi:hypothetical protein